MAEYIERGALEKELNRRLLYLRKENGYYDHYTDGYDEAVDTVENCQPAADVAPVVHGWWVWTNDECCHCSVCRHKAPVFTQYQDELTIVATDYCPICGALMDLD